MKSSYIPNFFFLLVITELFTAIPIELPGSGLTSTDSVAISGFLKKTSIALLGRKLEKEEYNQYYIIFINNGFNKNTRDSTIVLMMQTLDFATNMQSMMRQDYLEFVSQEVIDDFTLTFEFLFYSKKGFYPADTSGKYQNFFTESVNLEMADKDLYSKKIQLKDMQRIMFFNMVYVSLNMGDDNYVISVFQHLLLRKPTKYELEQGKKMLSDKHAILFGRQGNSKLDFLKIIMTSDNYYESQAKYWYRIQNNSEPNDEYLLKYFLVFKKTDSLEILIKSILADYCHV